MLNRLSGLLKRAIGLVLAVAVAVTAGIIGLSSLAQAAAEPSEQNSPTQQDEDATAEPTLHGTFVDENLQWTQDKADDVAATTLTSKTLNAWKNDTAIAEISLLPTAGSIEGVTATASALTGADGATIAASNVELTYLESTQAYTGMPGWNSHPQRPVPTGDRAEANDILYEPASTPRDITVDQLQNIWVSVNVPAETAAGSYTGTVTVDAEDLAKPLALELTVEVSNQTLPAATTFTDGFDIELWQNPFASAEYYDVEAFSQEHFKLLTSQMQKYASIGGDAITTSIVDEAWDGQTYSANEVHFPSMIEWTKTTQGTWSFDYTDFDAWVQFNKDLGIGDRIVAYSISPWNGQVTYTDEADGETQVQRINESGNLTGALSEEWKAMWKAFLTDFVSHLQEKGWKDQTYIGIDERGFNSDAFDLVESVTGQDGQPLKIAGAMDSFTTKRALADRVDVLSIGSIAVKDHPDEFAEMLEQRGAQGLKTTIYTCTGHQPSSFALSAPGESYWTMMYSASVGADGFMRWAYDSWVADPLSDVTHNNFEAGDPFLIYPDEKDAETPTVKSSVRLEKMAQGVRDVNKLLALAGQSDEMKTQVDALLDTVKSTYPAGDIYLTEDGKQAVADDMAVIQTCIATLSTGGNCEEPEQPSENGQYAYYSFNDLETPTDQVIDEWGNDRNSTANTVAETPEGIDEQGIAVDPTHNVTFPINTELTSDWTVGYWAKSTVALTDRASILTSTDGARSFDARISAANEPVGVHVNADTGGFLTYTSYTMPNDQWVHFTWTKAPGEGLTLYVNGQEVQNNTWTDSNSFDAPIDVFGGVGFTGVLDEVKIYDRALGADEIAQVMSYPDMPESPSIKSTIPTYDLPEENLSDVEKKPNTDRQYLGQPDLVNAKQSDGTETLITAYPVGHGHGPLVMQTSTDSGETWVEKTDIPEGWANSLETPTMYTLDMTDGTQKLILITGRPQWAGNTTGGWDTSISTDGGKTWSEPQTFHAELNGSQNYSTVAMASLIQLKDDNGNLIDKWMGVYHNTGFTNYASYLTFDEDGNEQWSEPEPYLDQWRNIESSYQLCEVGMFRSPDGDRIVALARSQSHMHPSVMFYSDDEGETWSQPVELPGSLYGERHKAVYDPDTGKLVIFFREMTLDYNDNGVVESGDFMAGDWVAWVGTYDQLMNREQGDYRIRLEEDWSMNAYSGDTGYSGVVTDPDGTITAVSYGHWDKEFSEANAADGSYDVRTDLSYIKQAKFKLDYFEALHNGEDPEEPEESDQPTTTDEWKTRNLNLADYQQLEQELAGDDPMNWLFTGDSITHGVVHTNGLKRYSEYFEDYLRTNDLLCQDRSGDVVINTGVSSADTTWMRQDFGPYIEDHHADVVFMAFGMNDGRQNDRLVEIDDYVENLRAAVNDIRDAGGIPILMTQNFMREDNATDSNDNLNEVFEAERQLALEEDVILVDFNMWWTESNDGNRVNTELMNDGLHPNQTGHLLWSQFILSQLDMLDADSRLGQATTASVPQTGADINTNLAAEQDYVGSSGLDVDGFTVAPQKSFTGTSETVTDLTGLEAFAAAEEGSFTIRFRTSAEASATEAIIATFADQDSDKVLTASVVNGKARVSRNFGSGFDFFSLQPVVNDGNFHTLTVNLKDDGLKIWVDGTQVLDWSNNAANMGPHQFDIDTVTLGGALESQLPEMHKADQSAPTNAVVDIDYLEAFPQVLTDAQGTSVNNGDAEENYVDPAIVAMYDIQNNNPRSVTWSVLGGATTQGTMAELSAKNWVQTFQEVFSYEHNANCSIPAGVVNTGENYVGCANRMKYVVNAALRGLSSDDLLARYITSVQDQESDVVVIAPDIIYQGEVVEESVASFKANIEALIDAVKADGAQVIVMSPAQLGDQVADYAVALKEIAQAETLTFVDASTWIKAVDDANEVDLSTDWFDASGQMRAKGQLELGKFFMTSIKLPVPSGGRIAALDFSGGEAATGTAPQFTKGAGCEASEPEPQPTTEPTTEPTTDPTDEPSGEPTDVPTGEPTGEPTDEPSAEPTDDPTGGGRGDQGNDDPADQASIQPSDQPSGSEKPGNVAKSVKAGTVVQSGLLARTGADLNVAAMTVLLLAAGGALAVSRRRQNH